MGGWVLQYEGDSIVSGLRLMSPRCFQAFGAACAEALVTDFGAEMPDHVLPQASLRAMVDACWAAVEGTSVTGATGPDAWISALDDVIDGDHYEELGVAEDVVIGLHYALDCVRDGDPGFAELVSLHLYEAADHVALREPPGDDAPLSGWWPSTDEHPLVEAVLEKIGALMQLVREQDGSGCASLAGFVRVRELARSRSADDRLRP